MQIPQEERDRRRELIHIVKPWKFSTGAKTERGKAISSQNAMKHGRYSTCTEVRAIARNKAEKEAMQIFTTKVIKVIKSFDTRV